MFTGHFIFGRILNRPSVSWNSPPFSEVEIPLIPILAEMELAGISVSTSVLEDLSVEFAGKLQLLEQEIYTLAGREFNIQSPKQLGVILLMNSVFLMAQDQEWLFN